MLRDHWAEVRIEQAAERMLRDYEPAIAARRALLWAIDMEDKKKRRFWIEVYKYIKDKQ